MLSFAAGVHARPPESSKPGKREYANACHNTVSSRVFGEDRVVVKPSDAVLAAHMRETQYVKKVIDSLSARPV